MKPAPFEYHVPATIDDATRLLADYGDDAKPLAGGQSLVPLLALRLTRFEHLVDLNKIAELQQVRRTDGTVTTGAMVRQATIEGDTTIAQHVPLLARATPLIGHFQIRNRGTVGGSLAHADPSSEYPAVALALDAEFEIRGRRGTRKVPAKDFFQSTFTTDVGSDELLTAIHWPAASAGWGFAIEEAARRHGDFAMVGVTCALRVGNGGRIDDARIALFGVDSVPRRAGDAERALVGRTAATLNSAALSELGALALHDLDPPADVHATSAYRKRIGATLVARAITNALKDVRHV